MALFVVCTAISNKGRQSGGAVTASASPAIERAEEPPSFITETCGELSKSFGTGSSLTELQQKALWGNYDNKHVKWSGTISQVGETFGTLQLHVKCLNSTISSDVIVSFPDSARASLMALRNGQRVTFSARLKDYNRFIGMSADNGHIVN